MLCHGSGLATQTLSDMVIEMELVGLRLNGVRRLSACVLFWINKWKLFIYAIMVLRMFFSASYDS